MSKRGRKSKRRMSRAPLRHRPDQAPEDAAMSDLESNKDDEEGSPRLRDDFWSILLLLFLYILQGIPIGLTASVPMILQARKVSYGNQALFSMATWPFSMKLLWAPLVDALYIKDFGRRKTWVIPTQYLIGAFMLVFSQYSDVLLEGNGEPNVHLLTIIFFCLFFLTATQDIAVDGWALTMLSKRNVGYQSTCNSVGQTIGYFLAYVIFLALESPHFCNKYLRSEPTAKGLVTLADFMFFWGVVFVATTTLLWAFKREKPTARSTDDTVSPLLVYKQSLDMLRRPVIRNYFIVILTSRIAFAGVDALTGLKLVEAGVPKENLGLLAVPVIPVQIVLPIVVARFTSGSRPMSAYLRAYPVRMGFGLILPAFVAWSRGFDGYPLHFYVLAAVIYIAYSIPCTTQFVANMAFNARIADPAIGATYMTFCNTVNNVATTWPNTLALALVEKFTWKYCDGGGGALDGATCVANEAEKECLAAGGSCLTHVDGYYVEVGLCLCFGLAWLGWMGRKMKRLQELDLSEWQLELKKSLKR